jgi:hypothetical protein
MAARQGDYSAASRLGRNLKDRCTKSDPERDVLGNMLEQLKNKWNSLRSTALQWCVFAYFTSGVKSSSVYEVRYFDLLSVS